MGGYATYGPWSVTPAIVAAGWNSSQCKIKNVRTPAWKVRAATWPYVTLCTALGLVIYLTSENPPDPVTHMYLCIYPPVAGLKYAWSQITEVDSGWVWPSAGRILRDRNRTSLCALCMPHILTPTLWQLNLQIEIWPSNHEACKGNNGFGDFGAMFSLLTTPAGWALILVVCDINLNFSWLRLNWRE